MAAELFMSNGSTLAVLDNRIGNLRIASWSLDIDLRSPAAADESEAPFPNVPPQICARRYGADLLDRVLADVRHEHVPVLWIPEKPLRIAHAISIDLGQRVVLAVIGKGIGCRHAVLHVGAVVAEWVEPENLAERGIEILRMSKRIAATAAVRETHIEKTVVRIPGLRERIERQMSCVVIGERLLETN